MYPAALKVFREVEEEVVRVAGHYVERYAAQLHAGGQGEVAEEIDRCGLAGWCRDVCAYGCLWACVVDGAWL